MQDYEVYVESSDGDVYSGHERKVIQNIINYHGVDEAEALDRLKCSDIDHPITLNDNESCWVEWSK